MASHLCSYLPSLSFGSRCIEKPEREIENEVDLVFGVVFPFTIKYSKQVCCFNCAEGLNLIYPCMLLSVQTIYTKHNYCVYGFFFLLFPVHNGLKVFIFFLSFFLLSSRMAQTVRDFCYTYILPTTKSKPWSVCVSTFSTFAEIVKMRPEK